MNISWMTEAVGYLASFLLIISFTMKNVRWLRGINSLGCACWIIYGFLLDISWPLVITNGFILGINVWHLAKKS